MIGIFYLILAILPLPIGVWWFYRMRQEKTLSPRSNVGYLLLAIFSTYNSLMCMVDTHLNTSKTLVVARLVEDFFTLLIVPITYTIVSDITKNNVRKSQLFLAFLPALLVGTINVIAYFTNISPFARHINTYLFNFTIFLQLLLLGHAILNKFYTYRKRILNYYVDLQTTNFSNVFAIVGCFFLVTLIAYLQLLFQRASYDGIHIILPYSSVCIAIIICIVGWNMSCLDSDTVVIDATSKKYSPAEVMELVKNIGMGLEETKSANSEVSPSDTPSSQAIEDIITSWAQRSDKPYLKEGISLSMAAEEMGLTVRIVSFYLNNVLQINFNAWINTMRIEEVKRLLHKPVPPSLSTIALKCGYADMPMLSKNFKKIVGTTITEYKRKNNLI